MARRKKSLAHNAPDANPYESYHVKVSPYHREHRSKKNRRKAGKIRNQFLSDRRRKIEKLKIKELEEESVDN